MNKVEEYLKEGGIEFKRHNHPAVFTCEEADKYCSEIPGLSCKNLVLKSKGGKRHFLVVLPSEKRADLKKIAEVVGEKKISFASAEILMEKLGLEPGSVSPFGLINDKKKEIEVYIDSEVYESEIVTFHPNDNRATLELSKEMFHKYLEGLEHEVKVIN